LAHFNYTVDFSLGYIFSRKSLGLLSSSIFYTGGPKRLPISSLFNVVCNRVLIKLAQLN